MATQSNIDIKIIAEFLGKNAFKQADSAATKLNKSVKSLGQSFGLAFGGAALGYAIKSTIRDFADAQRETQQLTNTVKNLGLAFAAPEVDAYVQKIGKLYGVTGDQAVPAMQALLTATGSVSRSTAIMNTALDLAASRNADVASVAQDLANAYVGNTKGLKQYRLGLTNAELAAMTFDEILEKIGSQTLGAADEAAKTLTGQLAILAEVSNQAKERIGGGLVEALGGLSGADGAGGAAKNIENLSIKLTNAITGFGYLVQEIKIAQPILVAAGVAVGLAWAPWFTAIGVAALAIGAIGNAMKKNTPQIAVNTGKLFFPGAGDGGYQERLKAEAKAEKEALARAKALAKLVQDQAKNQAKILKDKRLQNAIDKANQLLNKGEEVFDLDKIQIAAALTSQAEQLGKATNGAQLLQIANDTARLNVKKSILDLEDAIAAKDEAAIIAATKKLNEDLKIVAALSGQNVKLQDIKSILDSLKPKDLINLANLDAAIAKMMELLRLQGAKPSASSAGSTGSTGSTGGATIFPFPNGATSIAETNANVAALGGVITQILPNLKEFTLDSGMISGISPNGREYNYSVTVNTGIGDPNAIAEAIDQVLTDAAQRGTLRGYTIA
jgi:hypothetical protein